MSHCTLETTAQRFFGLVAITCCSLALAGCGPDEPFTHAQIHGKITYEDGTPIKAYKVRVEFNPQAEAIDPKTHPRAGVVELEPDGSFSDVSTHKYADGVVIGKHKVTVIPLNEKELETNAVPREYQRSNTTPLEIDTEDYSGGEPVELTVPKP